MARRAYNGEVVGSVCPVSRPATPAVRARYDSAQSSDDLRKHFAQADGLSAASANTLDVRRKLWIRARYEFQNNTYCEGPINTLASEVVGVGPRPLIVGGDPAVNSFIQQTWREWSTEIGLPETLELLLTSRTTDGEGDAIKTTDETLVSPVKLRLEPIECDQLSSSWGATNRIDGLELGPNKRPTFYHILREHPGDTWVTTPTQHDRLPASLVIHWFRRRRPGQYRGYSEITAALPLFALLRRFTLATLSAAETAANFAAMLQSDADADPTSVASATAFDELEISRNMMTVLPAGWKINQLKAEHPGTTYESFKREILKEIGRVLDMPYCVIAGDSSPYNYSAAKLDRELWRARVRRERQHCSNIVVESIWADFIRELTLGGLIPPGRYPHKWLWSGWYPIEPLDDAKANSERLLNKTATLAGILAERGEDLDEHLQQLARERDAAEKLGISLDVVSPTSPLPSEATPPNDPMQ